MIKSFKHNCQPHPSPQIPTTTVATRRGLRRRALGSGIRTFAKRQIQSAERRGPRLRSGGTDRSGRIGAHGATREVETRHALPVRRPLQGVRDIPPATAAARPNGQKRYLRARERAPAEQFPVGSKNWSEVEYAAPAREFPALEKMPCNASKNSPFPCVGNFASSRTRLAAAIQSQCDEITAPPKSLARMCGVGSHFSGFAVVW